MRLEDRIAVVTGGGGHLGQAICLGLAREGAHVVVSDFDLGNAEDVSRQVEKEGYQNFIIDSTPNGFVGFQTIVTTPSLRRNAPYR